MVVVIELRHGGMHELVGQHPILMKALRRGVLSQNHARVHIGRTAQDPAFAGIRINLDDGVGNRKLTEVSCSRIGGDSYPVESACPDVRWLSPPSQSVQAQLGLSRL